MRSDSFNPGTVNNRAVLQGQEKKDRVIHFFLSKKISENIDFPSLNEFISENYKSETTPEKIYFHSGNTSEAEAKSIAASLNSSELNSCFSASDGVDIAEKFTHFANGKISIQVSFDPKDKISIKNTVIIHQKGNPDNLPSNNQTFELNIAGNNTEGLDIFTHGGYMIAPKYHKNLSPINAYKSDVIFAGGYVLMQRAEFKSACFHFENLVAKANSDNSGIDLENAHVFNFEMISRVNKACAEKDDLNLTLVMDDVRILRPGEKTPSNIVSRRRINVSYSEEDSNIMSRRPQVIIAARREPNSGAFFANPKDGSDDQGYVISTFEVKNK